MNAWIINRMIAMCDLALMFSEGAGDQEEINEVIKIKNFFLRKLEKLESTKDTQ